MKNVIEISMDDYADSLLEIIIREDINEEMVTRDELKILRKYIS